MVSRSPLVPTTLCPDRTTYLSPQELIFRSLKFQGTERFSLQALINASYMTTDGKHGIISVDAIQGNGNDNFGLSSQLEDLCSKYEATDLIPDYENSRSGFSGVINLRSPVAGTYTMNMNIDTTDGDNLGGFYFRYNTSWMINSATTIDAIKTAFDAL